MKNRFGWKVAGLIAVIIAGAVFGWAISGGSADSAQITYNNFPASVFAGQNFSVTVKVKNTGTSTWTKATGYKLGGIGNSDPFVSTARVPLPTNASVAPGQTFAFTFTMTAPTTPGNYTTDWKMIRESVHWFGNSISKTVTVTVPPSANASIIVSSNIPIEMVAASLYSASVTVKNTGTTTWTKAAGYKLGSPQNSDPFVTPARVDLPATAAIAPGQSHTFTFTMTAPATPGSYVTDWRMIREGVQWFGSIVSKTVAVVGVPPTAFSLASPANAAQVPENVTLTWTDSSNENAYRIRIDTEQDFAEPLVYAVNAISVNTTSFTVPPGFLQPDTTYYWKVNAVNQYGVTSAQNSPRYFHTEPLPIPPAAFNLTAPASGSSTTTAPLLTWQATSGEDHFILQVDSQNSFAAPLVYENSGIGENSNSFQIPAGTLSLGATYFWRVIAANNFGQTMASNAPFSFVASVNPNAGPETPLDARRRQLLQKVDGWYKSAPGDPVYPGPNLKLSGGYHEFYFQEKVLAVLGLVNLGIAPASRIEEANKLLRFELLGQYKVTNAGQINGQYAVHWNHRERSLGMRIWFLFNNWLDADLKQEYEKRLSWLLVGAYDSSSENIKFSNNSARFLAHEYLNQTDTSTFASVKGWLVDRLKGIGQWGPSEWGSTYNMWTHCAILNLAEFAQDPQIKKLATMAIDFFFAQQSGFQVAGNYCSGGIRVYGHWLYAYDTPQSVAGQVLFFGNAFVESTVRYHGTWVEWGVSNYRPPVAIENLMMAQQGSEAKMTSWGKDHRCYRGNKFAIATIQNLVDNYYGLDGQSETHNIVNCYVMSSNGDVNQVIPTTIPPNYIKYRSTVDKSFGYANVAFSNGGGFCKKAWSGGTANNVPIRLFCQKNYSWQISGKWAFLTDGITYVAWTPTKGNPIFDPESAELADPAKVGYYLKSDFTPDETGETAVIEAGDGAMFGSFENFKNDIISRNPNPTWTDGKVVYVAKDGATIEFGTNSAYVNGQAFDQANWPRAQMFGLNNFTISSGGATITYDFSGGNIIGNVARMQVNKVFGF